ncbi:MULTISPECIES: hypothetical protein [unclassified Streptomyces]|uniref:hypothetical protein n=1 Tax=unclassified Streptomyces TaxID=2593676 RepID=UPI00339FFE0A
MSGAFARLRVRLVLLLGAAEIHLRLRLPRRPARPAEPLAELVRIEADPAYRALFYAELHVALEDRFATETAVVEEIEAASERLKALIRHDDHERAA